MLFGMLKYDLLMKKWERVMKFTHKKKMVNFHEISTWSFEKGSLNCALKLFLLKNFLNQLDLITNSFYFLNFNFH